MKIRLRGERAPREVRAFVRWLEDAIGVKHKVDVHLTSKLYGYFDAPNVRTEAPYMVITLDAVVLVTLAHEFVHYEQWRDKRDVNERGVEQRARALVKRWKKEGT